MSITIGTWIIPTFVSLALWLVMTRPYKSSGQYDFGALFRFFWLIPIFAIWAAYFGIQLIAKG